MKKIFFIALLLSALYSYSQECKLTYQGVILDEHDSRPVVNAKIVFKELNKTYSTDDYGYFKIDSLCSQNYSVHYFHHIGCEPVKKILDLAQSKMDTIYLEHHYEETVTSLNKIIVRSEIAYLPRTQGTTINWRDARIESGKNWAETLKTIPGVTSLSSGANIQKPAIHGMFGNRVLTVVDGARLEGQQWGMEHAPEINPFAYSQTTVIKGASALAYGSDAVGGVIVSNMDFHPYYPIKGSVDLGYGSNGNQFFGNVLLKGRFDKNNKFGWFAQGSYKKGGTMRSPTYNLANTGMEEINTTYAVNYTTDKWYSHLAYTYHEGKNGILSGSHFDNLEELNNAFQATSPAEIGKFTYRIDEPKLLTKHHLAVWNNKFLINSKNSIEVNYSFQLNNRSELHHHDHEEEDHEEEDHEEENHEEEGSQLKLLTQNITVNYNHFSFERKLIGKIGVNYWNQHNQAYGEYLIPNYLKNVLGVYAIEKWRFNEKHELGGGLRYDFSHINSSKIENQSFSKRSNLYNNLTGTIEYTYTHDHHFSFNTAIGNTWRTPAINELFSNGIHDAVYDIGNPNLKTEQAVFGTFSPRYSTKKLIVQADIYHYYFFNYINYHASPTLIETNEGIFPTYEYQQTKATYSGFDLFASYKVLKWLSISVKGSTVRAFDVNSKAHLASIPADRITPSLDFQYTLSKNNGFSWDNRHDLFFRISSPIVNRQYKAPVEYEIVKAPKGYALLNLTAMYTFDYKTGSVTFSANVDNLFNTKYRDYMNRYRYFVNEIGRSFYFKVNVNF